MTGGSCVIPDKANERMQIETSYLREKAHYCVTLARDCPDLRIAQALEALGVELMERAADIERICSLAPTTPDDGRQAESC